MRQPFLYAAVLLAGFLGTVSAAPVCTTQPLSVYITPGFECSFAGDFTIQNVTFSAQNLGSVPVTLATAADIMVTPPTAIGGGFRFESDLFDITGEQHAGYYLNYFIDPPPPIIPGFGDEMFTFTPVAPGYARLVTDVCVDGGRFGGDIGCSREDRFHLEVFHNGLPDGVFQLFDQVKFPQPTNKIDVRNFLELNANGASSQIRGFENVIGLSTPEPGAFLLAGVGLAALALLRRR